MELLNATKTITRICNMEDKIYNIVLDGIKANKITEELANKILVEVKTARGNIAYSAVDIDEILK